MFVQVLNGLAFGVLLLVLSSGLALIFGLRGVVNFAHGAIYMLAAYVGLSVSDRTSFWFALLTVPVLLAGAGLLVDRYGLRFLVGRSPLDMVLLTFGITFVVADVVQTFWGTQARTIDPPAVLAGSTDLGFATYPTYRLFVIVMGLLVCAGLMAWLRFSRTGLFVRAAGDDRVTSGAMGINVDRVSATVVALGFGLAGLAGVLAGPYLTLSPAMGTEILITTFIVVVVGGLGSIGGPMVAALLIGLANSLATVQAPTLAAYVPYLLMLVVLLLRPQGIAGRRTAL
ncbi:branched-chain amino acid ABC transporter permease [Nocardioides nitrophenolicus]|uniref:branched-chain amino acid ABC transporter permease n=1 Tax=Nocardioides nitrophenolicus TaxID=60489 RepID=UPI00195B9210|nr:branched-chain amino acid ABC transporter permease [Nocardioides nitrophenolicus]MBM7517956.1 branched-chain amino acid transport system permease protein [Nocardioides nitrophenolicus]